MSLLIRTQSDWIRSNSFILTLFISLKALSPNTVTFWGTKGWGFNLWILEGHSLARNSHQSDLTRVTYFSQVTRNSQGSWSGPVKPLKASRSRASPFPVLPQCTALMVKTTRQRLQVPRKAKKEPGGRSLSLAGLNQASHSGCRGSQRGQYVWVSTLLHWTKIISSIRKQGETAVSHAPHWRTGHLTDACDVHRCHTDLGWPKAICTPINVWPRINSLPSMDQ